MIDIKKEVDLVQEYRDHIDPEKIHAGSVGIYVRL